MADPDQPFPRVGAPQIPPRLTALAHRLVSAEAGGVDHPAAVADALDRACGALRQRLAPLVSAAGFDALVHRAVTLAARDFPFLAAVGSRSPVRPLDGLVLAIDGSPSDKARAA